MSLSRILTLVLVTWIVGSGAGQAMGGTAGVHYGGRLTGSDGAPLGGPVDLSVQFFDAARGGSELRSEPLVIRGVALASGVFQVELALTAADLDRMFGTGRGVYVEVTDVTHRKTYPRQAFGAVPYALRVPVDGTSVVYDGAGNLSVGSVDAAKVTGLGATLAAKADAAQALAGGDLSGNLAAPVVAKLQGAPLSMGTPSAGQVLTYDGATWVPAAPAVGSGSPGANLTTTGSLGVGVPVPTSAVDVAGVITDRGTAGVPGVSAAGQGRLYFDQSSGRFKVSENGGAYAVVLSGTVGTAGAYTKVVTDAYGRVTAGTSLTAGDLPVVPVGMISGTLAAAQVAAIPVSQLAGTLATAQLPSVPVTQLSGTLTAAQLPSLSAAEVTSGTLAVALGGTGVTSFPSGGVVVGAGSLPLSTTSAASQYQVLQQGGGGPVFGAVDLGQSAAVTGTLAVAHLPAIPAGLVTGTLAAAQVAPIPAGQITGTLAAAQIAAIPTSQITGTLAAAQVAALPTSQITGTLAAAQVSAIPTTQLTGTLATAQLAAAGAAGQVQFNGGGTLAADANLFWDDTNKRLGLGTTSPGGRLDVVSTIAAAGPKAIATGSLSSTSGGGFNAQVSTLPTASGQRLGGFFFGANNGTSEYNTAAITGFAAEPLTGSARGSEIHFETSPLGGTTRLERMRIDASGNVGIGSASPGFPLDVNGSARAGNLFSTGLLGVGTVTPNRAVQIYTNNAGLAVQDSNAGGHEYVLTNLLTGDGSFGLYDQTTSSWKWLATSSGNFGIATSAPAATLDVVSTSSLTPRGITSSQFNNGLNAAYFVGRKARGTPSAPTSVANLDIITGLDPEAFDGTAWQDVGFAGYVIDGTPAAGSVPSAFYVMTGSNNWGVERMRISSAGNVGIGSSSPGARLDVVGGGIRNDGYNVLVNIGTATQSAGVNALGQTWVDVPGATLTFNLSRTMTVRMRGMGSVTAATTGSSASTYAHCGFRFVIDGTGQGETSWGNQIVGVNRANSGAPGWWSTWAITQDSALASGSHTIKLQMTGWSSSDLYCSMDGQPYDVAKLVLEAY